MFTCLESKSNPFFSWHTPTRWLLTLILMFNILFAGQSSVSLLVRTIDTNSYSADLSHTLTSSSSEQSHHCVSSRPNRRFRKRFNPSFSKLPSKNWHALSSLCQFFQHPETILSLSKSRFVLNERSSTERKKKCVCAVGNVFSTLFY